MNKREENKELRISARLTGEDAALLREQTIRSGENISALLRKALRNYREEQIGLAGEAVISDVVVTTNESEGFLASPPPEIKVVPKAPATPKTPDSKASQLTGGTRPFSTDSQFAINNSQSSTRGNNSQSSTKGMDYGVGVRVLTVPFDPATGLFDDENLQRFLLNKQVRRLVPAFFSRAGHAFWSVWIEYEPPTVSALPKIGARAETILEPIQQLLYERLLAWRKAKAEAMGVPVFVVAVNLELIFVARQQPRTLEALSQIRGFGKRKIERHGRELIALVQGFIEER